MRMSSCFFSSRLKTRISAKSESSRRVSTALPNEPVPPVIRRILSLNRWSRFIGACFPEERFRELRGSFSPVSEEVFVNQRRFGGEGNGSVDASGENSL